MTQRNCRECSTPMVAPVWGYHDMACEMTDSEADMADMLTARSSQTCPECLKECVEHLLAMPEEDFEPMFAHYEECLSNC